VVQFEENLNHRPNGSDHRVATAHNLGLHLPQFEQLLFLSETVGFDVGAPPEGPDPAQNK